MHATLPELTQSLLQAANKAGATDADAIALRASSVMVDVRAGNLEQAERAESTDIGLRVFVDQRSAIVSASDTSENTLTDMAERAVAMAREAPEDRYAGIADPTQISKSHEIDVLELHDPAAGPTPVALQADAEAAEQAAMSVSGITQVQSASAGYVTQDIYMSATNGFHGGYKRTDRGISCVAIAGTGTGMERDYDGDHRVFQADLRAAKDIGKRAGQRALQRLDARKPPTGRFPVLFDERVSASLIGHLLNAMNGAAIARGSSWLRDALEEPVLPASFSLFEDPHRKRVGGSRPFDGEGLPTKPRYLVKDGILTGWTLDLASARKLGLTSTANAVRGTSSAPSPSASNVTLTQGTQSRDDLIRDMGTGLLVTSMIGSTINPNTGDYSRGAAGLWVERGQITHAVNECTIAGNLKDMLLQIVPANDAQTHLSRIVPSLLVPGMTLAGA
ncbi:MAG: TldD/PmbA family protein [Pseudomonadota bacterium]